jgi:hypothetical protein
MCTQLSMLLDMGTWMHDDCRREVLNIVQRAWCKNVVQVVLTAAGCWH